MTDPIEGRAWRFGSDVDTDVIIPSDHMRKPPEEYAKFAMEPVAPDFAASVEEGDIIVAEQHFGIGSSREQAAIALKLCGVRAIVAESFGRIFYRNAINQGLLAATADASVIATITDGDELRISPDAGTIENKTTGETEVFDRLEEPIRSIYRAGGAKAYYSKK
ncbi:LeuD/DmdB family oxidoreductase small subunit [Salinigranum halophilum]|uniref:LeuD/DmdB family oxidoreductase small subunit n=1 Tax=Salinigranum halophilum TaxID=2565931 RepID=UPI0010A80332|nr:3-isopropylmalate dehydratase small subunit [Salinigranum halophilum]